MNTSSHSNRTYKGLWALTGVSVCLCLSDNPVCCPSPSHPLISQYLHGSEAPCLGLEVRKSLMRVMAKPPSRNGPQIIHPPIHPQEGKSVLTGTECGGRWILS